MEVCWIIKILQIIPDISQRISAQFMEEQDSIYENPDISIIFVYHSLFRCKLRRSKKLGIDFTPRPYMDTPSLFQTIRPLLFVIRQ